MACHVPLACLPARGASPHNCYDPLLSLVASVLFREDNRSLSLFCAPLACILPTPAISLSGPHPRHSALFKCTCAPLHIAPWPPGLPAYTVPTCPRVCGVPPRPACPVSNTHRFPFPFPLFQWNGVCAIPLRARVRACVRACVIPSELYSPLFVRVWLPITPLTHFSWLMPCSGKGRGGFRKGGWFALSVLRRAAPGYVVCWRSMGMGMGWFGMVWSG